MVIEMDGHLAVMIFVGLYLIVGVIVLTGYIKPIEKKLEKMFKIKIKRPDDDYSYEGIVIWMPLVFGPLLLFMYYPIVVAYANLPAFLGIAVGFLYPSVVMLLRLRTFSDANIQVSTGMGYHPGAYLFISLGAGWFMVLRGFSMLNFPNIPSELSYIVLGMGLLAMTIPLFPDYLDKVMPVDLRSSSGLRLMGLIAVVLFIGTHIVWIVLQSKVFGI